MTQPNPQPRPEVMAFALAMEKTLKTHDKTKGDSYKTTDVDFLLMRLREEVKELHDQVLYEEQNGTLGARKNSFSESVDVGNIAMMLAYRLVPDPDSYIRATHTPAAPATEPNPCALCPYAILCSECDLHRLAEKARKDEREKVLDKKNITIIRKGCLHPYWETCGGLNCCQHFVEKTGDCLFDVDAFIESLRGGAP